MRLQIGYRLHEYKIDDVLGQGGFGITYLAQDTYLNRRVAIKEYFPKEIAIRTEDGRVEIGNQENQATFEWGLSRFLLEAQTLARFNHLNIVGVRRYFEGNNTAYMVMDFEEGESLGKFLRRMPEHMPESEILKLMDQLLDGLKVVHAAGVVHRDIKPENILFRMNGTPVLIDFGAARQAFMHGSQQMQMTVVGTFGYAPIEQFSTGGEQGAWTDIYALGAVVYRILSGKTPPNSHDRMRIKMERNTDPLVLDSPELREHYSLGFLQAVGAALQLSAHERPQSVQVWQEMLHSGQEGVTQRGSAQAPVGNDEATVLMAPELLAKAATAGAKSVVVDDGATIVGGLAPPPAPEKTPARSEPVISRPALSAVESKPSGGAPAPSVGESKPEKKNMAMLAVAGLVVVAGIGGGIFYATRSPEPTPAPVAVVTQPAKPVTEPLPTEPPLRKPQSAPVPETAPMVPSPLSTPPAPAEVVTPAPVVSTPAPIVTPPPPPPPEVIQKPTAPGVHMTSESKSDHYVNGDALRLAIRVDSDAYVYCFYQAGVKSGDKPTIVRLFPNRFLSNAKVTPATPLRIPNSAMPFKIVFDVPNSEERVRCFSSSQEISSQLAGRLGKEDLTPLSVADWRGLDWVMQEIADVQHEEFSVQELIFTVQDKRRK